MTSERGEVFIGLDPASAGAPVVAGRSADGFLMLEDETSQLLRPKSADGRSWAAVARKPGVLKLEVPLIQHATLGALTRSFEQAGRAAGKTAMMIQTLARIMHGRPVRPVPAPVPLGLSRVDSARRRAARSALLRERRRALRHNRKTPPPPRPRKISIANLKFTQDVAGQFRSGAIHISPGLPGD